VRHLVLAAAPLLSLLLAASAAAQTTYVAFGDSLTQGIGDDPEREENGYPPRLEERLADAGRVAVVLNRGRAGETTAEGVSRIDQVLADEGELLLLMEGTNDVSDRISVETILFNLEQMALKAQQLGIPTVVATVLPRLAGARTDGDNEVTAELAVELRLLAWSSDRLLVDPFEVFAHIPDAATELYVGGEDFFHLDADGYDLLATLFAEVLLDVDGVPPVPGRVSPPDGAEEVAAGTAIEVELFDFGTGIDLDATELLVDGAVVDPSFSGGAARLELTYLPAAPMSGAVDVVLRSADLADPPNTLDRRITSFTVVGAERLRGDIDNDDRVDGTDLVLLAIRFGSVRGDGRYRTFADLDDNGAIDGTDLAILAADFGRSLE
jgi:acyl-CoA thioesterase-1